jgi:hypothetical protein
MCKGWSDVADGIRTDETMAWRTNEKRTKREKNKSDVKRTTTQKTKDWATEDHEPH